MWGGKQLCVLRRIDNQWRWFGKKIRRAQMTRTMMVHLCRIWSNLCFCMRPKPGQWMRKTVHGDAVLETNTENTPWTARRTKVSVLKKLSVVQRLLNLVLSHILRYEYYIIIGGRNLGKTFIRKIAVKMDRLRGKLPQSFASEEYMQHRGLTNKAVVEKDQDRSTRSQTA